MGGNIVEYLSIPKPRESFLVITLKCSLIHSNIRSKNIFSEIYKKRKMTYMSFTKDRFSFFFGISPSLQTKAFFRSHFFGYTSGGTIMETRSH